jgi:ankyrin repeat protein
MQLLAAGVDARAAAAGGLTALHLAVRRRDWQLVWALLEAGADAGAAAEALDGATPQHLLCLAGKACRGQLVTAIAQAGADPIALT